MKIKDKQRTTIHPATRKDKHKLASLVHFESHVHRHLDWRHPLDWLGHHPYLIIEHDGDCVAALSCPPDPPGIAWIRLFAVSSSFSVESAWEYLWTAAQAQLKQLHSPVKVAVIPLDKWFWTSLESSGFNCTHKVIVLNWKVGEMLPDPGSSSAMIRPMKLEDLAAVKEIDAASFTAIWQNSLSSLEIAFQHAAIATVADGPDGIVGYQISTATSMGGHLARLAVQPQAQRQGIGYALVQDLLSQFTRRGSKTITVNTQQNNLASLAIYKKTGFQLAGEEYPVYEYEIATP